MMQGRLSHLLVEEGRAAATVIASCAGRSKTYVDFRTDVAAAVQSLRKAECRSGLLLTEDSYWAAVGLFALLEAGCAIVFPPNGRPGTLAAMTGSFDCMVSDQPQPHERSILLCDGASGGDHAVRPLDLAAPVTFFTSGSTGTAKRIDKTLGQLEQEALAIEAVFGRIVPPAACIQATVSHQHVYGLAFRLCWPLTSGRRFEGRTHDIWESALAGLERDAVLVTSPAHLKRLDGIPTQHHARRPSLMLSAGAPLPAEAVTTASQVFGLAPTEIFGSTETGAIAWRSHDVAGADWIPLPGVSIAADADGRMLARAPHVRGEQVSADLIDMLPNGGFRFRGRADSVVKVEGKRVDLLQVEQALRDLPWVMDAAVILLDSAQRIAAAVVTTPEGEDALHRLGAFRFGRQLQTALSTMLEPVGLPRRWRFVASLPTAALGKRQKAQIAALFDAVPAETVS